VSDILVLQVVVIACGTSAFVASLWFLRRYLELRQERSLRPPAPDLVRLERIEQVVEVTAVEVERLAEANRFLAKLLAERTTPIGPAAKPPERVITPH